jgi:hypothetical protein
MNMTIKGQTMNTFKKNTLRSLTAILLATSAVTALADSVFGEGRTPLGAGDAAAIRNTAKQAAMRDAVIQAIKDATALDASDPKFAPIVNEIAKQLNDVQVKEERREGNEFVTRVEANVDRTKIKNAIRGTDLDKLNDRSFAILALMDEFVTNTRDLNMPLKDLTEFSSDKGSTFSDKSMKAASASASSESAVAASKNVNAATASSAKVNANSNAAYSAQASGPYASQSATGGQSNSFNGQSASAASYSEKDSLAASASSKSASASIDQKNVQSESHDKVTYKHLVEYQDHSQPTANPIFQSAFLGNMRDYDLKFQDSSIAKSKFFGNKPIRMSTLDNSADMAKFSEFARTKSNSDFLLVGSSTVVQGDKDPATGNLTCAVNVAMKVFSTSDSEMIASDSEGMLASGINIESCAQNASKKIADHMSSKFAGRILGYWADRSARGREFIVELKGKTLTLPMRMAFAKAIKDIQGAVSVVKENSNAGVKVTVTLKGGNDPQEIVYTAVTAQSAFAGVNLDGIVQGTEVTFCIDTCAADAATKSSDSTKAKKK